MNNNELENRLIAFAVDVIKLVNHNSNNYAANHLANQIIRSATSCPLNYGEARGAESRKDFLHKLQLVLKELRETYINLIITKQAGLNNDIQNLESALKENNELIAIFVKMVTTTKKNNSK